MLCYYTLAAARKLGIEVFLTEDGIGTTKVIDHELFNTNCPRQGGANAYDRRQRKEVFFKRVQGVLNEYKVGDPRTAILSTESAEGARDQMFSLIGPCEI